MLFLEYLSLTVLNFIQIVLVSAILGYTGLYCEKFIQWLKG